MSDKEKTSEDVRIEKFCKNLGDRMLKNQIKAQTTKGNTPYLKALLEEKARRA